MRSRPVLLATSRRARGSRVLKGRLDKLALLTPRESQVLREVAAGRQNKQIAFDLGISEITVKLHRGNVMRKMQFASVGELVRAWEALPSEVRERVDTRPVGDPGHMAPRRLPHAATRLVVPMVASGRELCG